MGNVSARALGIILGAVILLLGGGLAVQTWRLGKRDRELRAESLARVNAEAARDSARDVSARLVGLLEQNQRAVERLVVQQQIDRDAIDRRLARVTQANVALTAQVQGLTDLVVAASSPATEDAAGVRSATFNVRQEPFSLLATAVLPPPAAPAPPRLNIQSLTVDPIVATLRLQCDRTRQAGGVRRATALLTGPDWAGLTLGHVQQDEAVCSAQDHATPWFSFGLFAGLGYGPQVERDGDVGMGWHGTIGLGVVTPLWPRR